ncbi:MAG: HypC/HybG/HupF family hydrogenase formation chaperone [Elusimicrobiota bacterium]|nr:HypC/HybG/HupF family hydrogenase formation chaperone [Endomicrobiia bacterium]MDW8165281.1 HypC/HybG/HupF family hydrogenase formation chaperone [Elusimicrobiota bacterium]
MCVAFPMKVIELIDNNYAICEYEGIRKKVRIDLLKDVNIGDYVLIHVGFAIQKINVEDAQKTIKVYKEIQNI